MKKCAAAFLLFSVMMCFSARAVPIAQWTFETSVPTTAGPLLPESGTGSAIASHANLSASYSNPAGNGSAESWSSDHWGVGDYWQFQVSTLGLQNIVLGWDQISSGTGPGSFGLFWSADGTSFSQIGGNYTVLNNTSSDTWSSSGSPKVGSHYDRDLSSILGLDDSNSIYFRLINESTTSAGGGTVAALGADRIDNFTVIGTEIPTRVPDSLPMWQSLLCVTSFLMFSKGCFQRKAALVLT